jgi:hypothetical protein
VHYAALAADVVPAAMGAGAFEAPRRMNSPRMPAAAGMAGRKD